MKRGYQPIILLHTQDPPTQNVVRYVEFLYKITLLEHSNGSTARVFVGEIKVDECETVEIVCFRGRYKIRDEA